MSMLFLEVSCGDLRKMMVDKDSNILDREEEKEQGDNGNYIYETDLRS